MPLQVDANEANARAARSFDALAARAPVVAPGMREVIRKESVGSQGDAIAMARADRRDTCVRVVFEASAPIVARLVDGNGTVLASTAAAATVGVLGQRGPVCVRKGDAVLAVAISPTDRPADTSQTQSSRPSHTYTTIRWVAWQSP